VAAAAVLAVLGPAGCSLSDYAAAPPPPAESPPGVMTAPATTEAAPAEPERLRLPRARGLEVPDGFRAEVYATGLEHPTAMAFGPRGLYVTEDVGRLVRVRPGDESPTVVAAGFDVPLGVALDGRDVYVSAMGELEWLRLDGRGEVARREPIVTGLPFGLHQQDNVVVGPDDRLYVGSGSTCNACEEGDPRSAAILSVERDGSDLEIFARGLRNPFGLAFEPRTERLFVSVNGRDDLLDEDGPGPADMIVVAKRGRDFGWPGCWPSIREQRLVGDCAGVTPPVAYLEEHSSANGMAFYTGETFPAEYRGNLFVALWGQYDSHAHGRRVERLVLRPDGRARRIEPFVEGLPHPLALAVEPRGGLLVADWERGAIYRIQAEGGA
jgi:glucose/arabinose dehydrogenase